MGLDAVEGLEGRERAEVKEMATGREDSSTGEE
jgi:hypothetical protein